MTARRHRTALAAPPLAAAIALVLTATNVVELPNLEHALTELSDTLGTWTYALVGGLAFLETGAFVGLIAPGETAIVLGGVVAAQGEVNLVAGAADRLGRRRARRPRLVRARRAARPPLPAHARPARRRDRRRGWSASRPSTPATARRRSSSGASSGSSARSRRSWPAPPACACAPSCPWSLLGTALWASAFTLVGYAFHESFSEAAGTLTHGALALAVLAAVVLLVARPPPRGGALTHADQVDDEHERLVGPDHAARAARAVGRGPAGS